MPPSLQALAVQLAQRRWPWWIGVMAWGGVLFMLSANSAPHTGPEFPFKDKIAHCLYFSAGAFCFALGLFSRPGVKVLRAVAWGLLFGALCGALDEWHQTFTPGRSGNDPDDWLADITGGLLGGWIAWHFLRRFSRPAGDRSP
ncbi:MAG: VanZ family protein [Prosthecobacter sp.]|nr:VanZ family protein [Prosthecobacter sp.]